MSSTLPAFLQDASLGERAAAVLEWEDASRDLDERDRVQLLADLLRQCLDSVRAHRRTAPALEGMRIAALAFVRAAAPFDESAARSGFRARMSAPKPISSSYRWAPDPPKPPPTETDYLALARASHEARKAVALEAARVELAAAWPAAREQALAFRDAPPPASPPFLKRPAATRLSDRDWAWLQSLKESDGANRGPSLPPLDSGALVTVDVKARAARLSDAAFVVLRAIVEACPNDASTTGTTKVGLDPKTVRKHLEGELADLVDRDERQRHSNLRPNALGRLVVEVPR